MSYTRHVDTDDPLTRAKRAVEERLRESGMAFTILRPSYFMEMWLGPALGMELAEGRAQVLGSGEQRVNWISAGDVVAAAVASVDNSDAYGHIAIGVDDLDGTLGRLNEQGIAPEREPYRVREGGSRLCFVRDPDQYRVEIIEQL